MKLSTLFSSQKVPKVRLHPRIFGQISPHISALVCHLACDTAAADVGRMAVTRPILRKAEELKLEKTPIELHRAAKQWFKAIANQLDPEGLIDPDTGIWPLDRLDLKGHGDKETLQAILENGDEFVICPPPISIPAWVDNISIRPISIRNMFLAAYEQAQALLSKSIEEHRRNLGWNKNDYRDFLDDNELDGLDPLV